MKSADYICRPLPIPKEFSVEEEPFLLEDTYFCPDAIQPVAEALSDAVGRMHGTRLRRTDVPEAAFRFTLDDTLKTEEYRVVSADGAVTLYASDAAGFACACSLVLQILFSSKYGNHLHAFPCTAHDYPDTMWRGLMVDLARAYYSVEDIKKFADQCFFYRIRFMHLHLSDGGAYVVPSKGYPKTLGGKITYTQEEVDEIRRYLSDRAITLVPEIEMPGHSGRLSETYPEVFGGKHGELLCIGREGVFDALETLIDEICTMFPDSPYIHVGGDEARHSAWNDCEECRRFMADHYLSDTSDAYAYAVGRCAQYVLDRGRIPMVWEGFHKPGNHRIPKETIVCVFSSGYQNALSLTEDGFRVLNTSFNPLYIVPSRPTYWTPKNLYDWQLNRWLVGPDNGEQTAIEPDDALIPGAELCLWEGTDYAHDGPITARNLAPVAERLWNRERLEPYGDFAERCDMADAKLHLMICPRKR